MRVLVLHGPNLTLSMGEVSLADIDDALQRAAKDAGHELKTFQANAEVALLERLHAEREWVEAVIVNPVALAPVAFSLADALMRLGKRAFEVQLDALPKAWPASALAEAVEASFIGDGVESYLAALEALEDAPSPAPTAPERKKKSLGRVEEDERPTATAKPAPERSKKTLGRDVAPKAAAEPASGEKPRKTLGRDVAAEKSAAPKSPASGALITRAAVKAKASARLSGSLAPEALAAWARAQWQLLVTGGDVEPGAKDVIEDVLLTLSASAKATDHAILAVIAKLDT